MRKTIQTLLIIGLLTFTSCKEPSVRSRATLQPAPTIISKTINGEPFVLSNFEGKVVLINFWATYCGYCKQQESWLKSVKAKYGDRSDFVMVGVTIDKSADKAAGHIRRSGLSWMQLHEPLGGGPTSAARMLGVRALPMYYLVHKDGRIQRIGAKSNRSIAAALKEGVYAADTRCKRCKKNDCKTDLSGKEGFANL